VPAEAVDELKGAAGQKANGSSNGSCGNAKLKHGRPRGRCVNLKSDHEPGDGPGDPGQEASRARTVPGRRICPDLGNQAFHLASDYRPNGQSVRRERGQEMPVDW
jgi:hypothetical protein